MSAIHFVDTERVKLQDVEWTNKDSITAAFPRYIREQFALARAKNVSRTVDINPFDLKVPFSQAYLLRDAHLLLEPNKRTVLVGEAGTGKSTLFDTLAAGTIKDFPHHLQVYLCQEIEITSEEVGARSVLDTVVRAHEYRNILLDCMDELQKRITADPAPAAGVMDDLKSSREFVEFQLQKIGSSDAESRASKMLRVLGFDEVGQTKPISSLSGGLRMRVALCAAFFVEPDLLLLDEPTNHLDFPSVLWLENRLRSYRKSFLMVCHDREMLNTVCTSVMLLADKRITYYNCGFQDFEKKKAAADKKYAEEVDKFMLKHRNLDFSSPLAREKQEKKDWLEAFQAKQLLLAGKFTFPPTKPLNEVDEKGQPLAPENVSLINIKNVRFSYNPENLPFIFDTPISLNVTCATRMGVMGPNGAGKSTLLKLLMNKLKPVEGEISRHRTANVAYFAQHHVAELDLKQTAIEFMIEEFPHIKNHGFLRKHLEKVGITGNLMETRMHQLSPGQRSCIIFAKITYECPHLLIMDEPTNFLDLEAIDALIGAANKYPGALLLVSHNRQFLKKCAKQYLSVVPGRFEVYDDLKTCEKATYTFIEELELGTGAGKIGAGALAKSTSAGTNSVASIKGEVKEVKQEGAMVLGRGPSIGRGGPAMRGAPAGATRGAPAAGAAGGRGGAQAPQGGRGGAQGGRGGQQGGRGGQQGGRGGGRGGQQGGRGGRGGRGGF